MFELRSGLSFGAVGDRLVFMDIETNRYFLLPPTSEAAFRCLEEKDEIPATLRSLFSPPAAADRRETPERTPVPASVAPIARDASDWAGTESSRYRTGRALASRFRTEQHLRFRKLSFVLGHLDRRIGGLADDAWRHQIAMRIVRGYQDGRIWRHARDRCLSESISLFEQLIIAGCRAKLVFGVSLKPFAAHSWVQWGETVLNGHRDHARGYAPVYVL